MSNFAHYSSSKLPQSWFQALKSACFTFRDVSLYFYERASASALLVNGLLWQNPRDGVGGAVFAFC